MAYMNDFPEFCYYISTRFDTQNGKVPRELLTNYPKRCGMWTSDGTIIYIDETKNKQKIVMKLSDGNQTLIISDQGISLVTDQFVHLGNHNAADWVALSSLVNSGFADVIAAYDTHTHVAGALFDSVPLAVTGTTGAPSALITSIPDVKASKVKAI